VGEHGGARRDNGLLVLSKIGRLAVRWSRPIEGTPKTVTISGEADGWYACISCAEVRTAPLPPTGHETDIDVGLIDAGLIDVGLIDVGLIDVGLKGYLLVADGESVETPRHYRTAERRLAHAQAQRRVSRRKKGSRRRSKAIALLKRKQQQQQRQVQRRDFHHKTALALVRQDDRISLEDLQVCNLSRRCRPEPKLDGNGG
jgi:putative transposase